jgi:polyribonucleotide nucleotidyltransferase
LIEEILKNQNLVDKKVTYLKEKIANHKEDLTNKIESSVKNKVESRIEAIDKDEKYKNLDQSVKNKIYTDFINQIKSKLKELNESNLSDSYKQTRALIYNTMIENIESKIKK